MSLLPFDMGSNNGESVEIETIIMNGNYFTLFVF